ncbi:hypothetical protein N0V90_002078 [Kalmusia sp. IMI 367209]|nr:hypothetical protein N0V90_002078 [Kalmusia sp. IMI 367209]
MTDGTRLGKAPKEIKQGVEQLYPREDDYEAIAKTDIDVVFVPGLGAHPLKSWQPEPEDGDPSKTAWNWASDEQGILKEHPSARILLYWHESDWKGSFKVEQFLDNLAIGLLDSLRVIRPKGISRHPLVFIGHSMGGLIIAKAITHMHWRDDLYKDLLDATVGCVFFGTPFLGAEAAEVAEMFAGPGEKIGLTKNSPLLTIMKPGNEMLGEIIEKFHWIVSRKMNPKIEVHCFWEEIDTKVAEMGAEFVEKHVRSGVVKTLSRIAMPTKEFKIVSRDSATFRKAFDHTGLARNHRDLVKFNSRKDEIFQLVRRPFQTIFSDAKRIVRARLRYPNDPETQMAKITRVLGGGMIFQSKRKALQEKIGSSTWLSSAPVFKKWLSWTNDLDNTKDSSRRRGDSLWICGAEGRGKSGAFIAALDQVESVIEATNEHERKPLLVYYLCEPGESASTAEELLRSLIWQLIQEQPSLASYTKQFTERLGRRALTLPIDHLWQALQDMLSDTNINSCIYILINNLHNLPVDSDSTGKLFKFFKEELRTMNEEAANRTPVRWLFTSRKDIDWNLEGNTQVIDLENEYTSQVQRDFRQYAQKKVIGLANDKEYKRDLAYFVSSLIGNRAQSYGWIDIAIDQLEQLEEGERSSIVRQKLKALPTNLDDLLTEAWLTILKSNPSHSSAITDLLRVLALTYEDPSLEELAVLAGAEDAEEIRPLVELCSTFLALESTDDKEDVVRFKNDFAKPHLIRQSAKLLGISGDEIQWQQGELALRSLAHLISEYTLPGDDETLEAERTLAEENERNNQAQQVAGDEDDGDDGHEGLEEADDEKDEDTDEEYEEDEDEYLEVEALPYMVKHWLHHASKATPDLAEEISKETIFWDKVSLIRRRWLYQYKQLSDTFGFAASIPLEKWTSLHAASSFGYKRLVTALILNGHGDEVKEYDDWSYSPIHLAAFYGRQNIVKELIFRNAAVDDVKHRSHETPLAMAAYAGDTKVMQLLIAENADVNAKSTSGEKLVLNNAICSGNLDAVKLLVENGAAVHSDKYSPLKWAASLPDRKVYDYLLEVSNRHLKPCDFGMALSGAAQNGNTDILADLLEREHERRYLQSALDSASRKSEWNAVKMILKKHKGLGCEKLLTNVAKNTEASEGLLEDVLDYANGSISQEGLNQALYNATDAEKEDIVRKMLLLGANPNATGSVYGNALTAAAYDGRDDIVTMLLKAGAHVNSDKGWALQTAAGQGHLSIVNLLIDAGADVNLCTTDERFLPGTALQSAVESNRSDIVTLLLSKGADPNLGSGEYGSPLAAAAGKAHGEILKQLMARNAKVDCYGSAPSATTPLMYAAGSAPIEYVKMLLDAGAEVNHVDMNGDTALILAAAVGDTKSVECLLENGANIRVSSPNTGTALQAALKSGDQDCIEMLIEHVSKILLEDMKVIGLKNDGDAVALERKVEVEVNKSDNYDPATKTGANDHIGMQTNKWIEEKRSTYDGDDWGPYDRHDAYGIASKTPPPLKSPPGYYQSTGTYDRQYINGPGETSRNVEKIALTKVHQSDARFSDQLPSTQGHTYRGVDGIATWTPRPQNENKQYVPDYSRQEQYMYEVPPPQRLPEQYTPSHFPSHDRQEYYPRSQHPQQQHGSPPPALIPGNRTESRVANDLSFSTYGFFQK